MSKKHLFDVDGWTFCEGGSIVGPVHASSWRWRWDAKERCVMLVRMDVDLSGFATGEDEVETPDIEATKGYTQWLAGQVVEI